MNAHYRARDRYSIKIPTNQPTKQTNKKPYCRPWYEAKQYFLNTVASDLNQLLDNKNDMQKKFTSSQQKVN